MKKIAIYLFDDVEELGLSIIYNILKKTSILKELKILPIEKPLVVDLVSKKKQIVGSKEMIINPHKVISDFHDYDILIIPGGKGADTLIQDKEFLQKIRIFGKSKIVCSIGLGSMVLAEAGLLEGKKATTHHKHFLRLKQFCIIENKRVVKADNIITAGGMLCAVDLAELILELCYSKSISEIVLEYIEQESRPRGVRIDLGEIDEE